MTPLKGTATAGRIALAGVAVITLLMVFALPRTPAPAETAEEDERFDEAWIDIMRPLALKTAEIERAAYIPVSTDSKPVGHRNGEPDDAERIITPAPDGAPASMPPVVMVQDDDKPPATRHRRHRNGEPGQPRHRNSGSDDTCTRHGMHKAAVRGGKSWRCKR